MVRFACQHEFSVVGYKVHSEIAGICIMALHSLTIHFGSIMYDKNCICPFVYSVLQTYALEYQFPLTPSLYILHLMSPPTCHDSFMARCQLSINIANHP
jgi:hypothetical protein